MTALRLCLLAAISITGCRAQTPKTSSDAKQLRGLEYYTTLSKAREHNRAKEYDRAAPIFKRLLEANPDDSFLWREYGLMQSQQKDYRGSAESFIKAYELGTVFPASATLSVARMYARAGDKTKAYEWLEKTMAVPFEARPSLAQDGAFEFIAKEERFRALAGQLPEKEFGRETGWRYDIDYFLSEVKRMHYASWKYNALPANFEKEIETLKQRVPQLTDVQIRVELQRLITRLGDGHTRTQLLGTEGLRPVPHTFYLFADGLFVTGAPDDCACVGSRVTRIEGLDAHDVLRTLEPYASHENRMGLVQGTPNLARSPGLLRAIGIGKSAEVLNFEIEKGGARRSVVAKVEPSSPFGGLPVVQGLPVPLYQQKPGTNYWFEPLPGGKTMYFKFAAVLHQPQGDTIGEFANKLNKALHAGAFENIVVDVRLNGGGNLGLMTPLIRTLVNFEMSREKAKIYVITGRQTYSAAQVFINEVDHWTSPIFAGEPSSSSPNFIGESAPFRLPYSGVMGTISTRYHPTDTMDHRSMIVPRIPVALTSTDYFNGKDPVLEAVLAVIQTNH